MYKVRGRNPVGGNKKSGDEEFAHGHKFALDIYDIFLSRIDAVVNNGEYEFFRGGSHETRVERLHLIEREAWGE